MGKYTRSALMIATISITAGYSLWYFSPSFVVEAVEPIDVELGGRKVLAMPGEVIAYHSLDELRSAAANGAVEINRPIDFTRQKLIRVGWRAMGYRTAGIGAVDRLPATAVGRLKQTSRAGGSQIYFHIEQPLQESIAGEKVHEIAHRQHIGESWFLVDRHASISYAEFARPLRFDLFVLLLIFSVVHVSAWPWVQKRRPQRLPTLGPARHETFEWAAGS